MDFNLQSQPEGANDNADPQADNGTLASRIGEIVVAAAPDGGPQSQPPPAPAGAANDESNRLIASQAEETSSTAADKESESEPRSLANANSVANCRLAASTPETTETGSNRPSAPLASSRLPIAENYNLRSPAVKRLLKEAQEMSREPTNDIRAVPLEDNLFEWHYTIRGPGDSEFADGVYHGRIIMPPDYPLKPPAIMMLTPNGRFETGVKICLSISNYHPETWRPCWSIRTALMALISFMATPSPGAIGSLECSPEVRRRLARQSVAWVCPTCGPIIDDIGHRHAHESAPPADPSPAPAQRVFRLPHEHTPAAEIGDGRVHAEGPVDFPRFQFRQPVPNDEAGDHAIPDEEEDVGQDDNIPLPADDTAYRMFVGAVVLTIAALAFRRLYLLGFEF